MRRRPGQFGPSPRNPTPRRGGSRVPPTGPEREEPEPLSDPRQITACTTYRTPPKTSSAPSPMTIILVSRFIAATNAPTTTRRNTATEPSFKPKRLDSFLRNEDPSLRLQPDLRTLLALVLPSRMLSMSKVSRLPFLILSGSMPADCSGSSRCPIYNGRSTGRLPDGSRAPALTKVGTALGIASCHAGAGNGSPQFQRWFFLDDWR